MKINLYMIVVLLSAVMICNAKFERSPKNFFAGRYLCLKKEFYNVKIWQKLNDKWRVVVWKKKDFTDDMYLSIGGQKFYIYSALNSDVLFKNNELDVKFLDLNGDGCLDLLISGIVNYTSKIDYEIYEQENVVFIYLCNLKKQRFDLEFKKATFDLEVKKSAEKQWEKQYTSNEKKFEKMKLLDKQKSNSFCIKDQRKWHYSFSMRYALKKEVKDMLKNGASEFKIKRIPLKKKAKGFYPE